MHLLLVSASKFGSVALTNRTGSDDNCNAGGGWFSTNYNVTLPSEVDNQLNSVNCTTNEQ